MPEENIEETFDNPSDETEENPSQPIEVDNETSKRLEELEAQNKKLYARVKTAEEKAKAVKPQEFSVETFIDVSESLEGLDAREKSRLLQEHKATGKPLKELRSDEDFQLWQQAYKTKVEKEKTPLPSTTPNETDKPMSLNERLANANTLSEKETILKEAGLYSEPTPMQEKYVRDVRR